MGNSLYKSIFGDCDVRVLMLGLDAAGKTTILYKLKLGEIITTIPTIGFNVESMQHNDFSLTTWDVGTRDKSRPLLRHYFQNTDALMFVIDSSDKERYNEAIEEFLGMTVNEDELRNVVYLIVANKQDCNDVMTPNDITDVLIKRGILSGFAWKVFGVCGTTGDGLVEALDWLTDSLAHLRVREGCLRGYLPSRPAIRNSSINEKRNNAKIGDSDRKTEHGNSFYSAFVHSLKSMLWSAKK